VSVCAFERERGGKKGCTNWGHNSLVSGTFQWFCFGGKDDYDIPTRGRVTCNISMGHHFFFPCCLWH